MSIEESDINNIINAINECKSDEEAVEECIRNHTANNSAIFNDNQINILLLESIRDFCCGSELHTEKFHQIMLEWILHDFAICNRGEDPKVVTELCKLYFQTASIDELNELVIEQEGMTLPQLLNMAPLGSEDRQWWNEKTVTLTQDNVPPRRRLTL